MNMSKLKQWNPELDVGVALIDNQHKIIFDLLYDLSMTATAKTDAKAIDTLLGVIENYVFRHFEAEEELFQGHKDANAHKLLHYELIKEFRRYRLGFRCNNAERPPPSFLEQWFFRHIEEEDLPLFAALAAGENGLKKIPAVDAYPLGTREQERRRHKRIKQGKITSHTIMADCYNTSRLQHNAAILVDISLGGIRIESPGPYKIGDLLAISCRIGKNFKLEEKVRVVNVDGQSYGAEFINLAPAAQTFLSQLYGAMGACRY